MLSQEQNERLTRVGPGTPMGNLMRSYWMPIAGVSEFEQEATKKVRLLGEDLVLYKDLKGRYGLIGEKCCHRRVSLVYGMPEEEGLRCPYHGWLYNAEGACIEQPAEPEESNFKDRICNVSYPVKEQGGLIFAYLGVKPAPALPKYDVYANKGAIRQIGYTIFPCNWLQIMENSLDATHLEWLHGVYFKYVSDKKGIPFKRVIKQHKKIGFDVFEHGIMKRRMFEGETEESQNWKVGHPIVFPNILGVGIGHKDISTFQVRVPMDDENTLIWWYSCFQPSDVEVPEQKSIPVFEVPYKDEEGNFTLDTIEGQDMMCWITQGAIADRSEERIGTSDKGVIMYRQVLQEQMVKVERGEDPLGIIRDENHEMIGLPHEVRGKDNWTGKNIADSIKGMPTGRYMPDLEDILKLFEESEKQKHAASS